MGGSNRAVSDSYGKPSRTEAPSVCALTSASCRSPTAHWDVPPLRGGPPHMLGVMPENMKIASIGKACLISPIVALVIYYIGAAALMNMSPDNKSSLLGAFMFIMFFGIPVSYIATLIIGIPVYQYLDKRGVLSRTNLTVSGGVLGALVLVMFFWSVSGFGGLDMKEIVFISSIGAVLGASVAFTFGAIAGITRPSIGRSR